MRCAWAGSRANRKALVVVLAAASCFLALYPVASGPSLVLHRTPVRGREKTLHTVPAHISEFSPVSEPLSLPRCESVSPPQALLTPDPLLTVQDNYMQVRVSFIVGTDGSVHSAFILESGGPNEDRMVLRTVRSWRYRPALCNGVPTDYEALVRFSIP